MKEKEIREKFQPKHYEVQGEFDAVMHEINDEQTKANAPYNDKLRQLDIEKNEIEQKIAQLNLKKQENKGKRLQIEQVKKEMNRVFHEIKHELISLNPKLPKEQTEE